MDLDKLILDELTSYYQADEIGDVAGARFRGALTERARVSAIRLGRGAPGPARRALIDRLNALRQDPNDPLVGEITRWTTIGWSDEPELWAVFGELLTAIAAQLAPPKS